MLRWFPKDKKKIFHNIPYKSLRVYFIRIRLMPPGHASHVTFTGTLEATPFKSFFSLKSKTRYDITLSMQYITY